MTPESLSHVWTVLGTHRREKYGFKNTLLGQALPWVVPLIRQIGDEVSVVAVHRTLLSCAYGRAAGRCGVPFGKTFPLEEAIQWAIEAKMSLLRGVLTVQNWGIPVHHLSFEHLLDDPEAEIGKIAEFLGVDVTEEALAQVKPELVHS